MATFVALIIKKLEDEEKSEVEKQARVLAKNEDWLHSSYDPTAESNYEVHPCPKPPNPLHLQQLRELRLKQLKMRAIGWEFLFYGFFAFIVFVLGLSTRDYQAYHQTTNTKDVFQITVRLLPKYYKDQFHYANRKDLVWNYLEKIFLPNIYPEKWYDLDTAYENKSFYNFPDNRYLVDLNSKIVTGARLRQVRVDKNSCKIPKRMQPFISIDCAGNYERSTEDTKDFHYSWKKLSGKQRSKITRYNEAWKYQKWSQMDSYPIRGTYDLYFGGGYAQEFFPKWNNREALEKLKQRLWIDRHSRAVIIEFAVYNGATNYFQNVEMVFEFPPTGGIIHYNTVNTFKLYNDTSKYATLVLCSALIFVVFMLYFTVRESRRIYRYRGKYFTEFWNLVEFLNIFLSIIAVGFYLYKYIIAKEIFSRMPEKAPQTYISMQFAAFWDLTYSNIVALISFFVILKFIKMLRFNRRISMLSSTLKKAWYPLSMFGILFALVVVSCTIFAYLIFGRTLYDYHTFFRSLSSIFSLLLGKFSYDEFKSGNRFLGPVFFFTFSVMVNWIIMNMFIAILNDILEEVHNNEDLQNNEYEIVDYFVESLKSLLKISTKKEVEEVVVRRPRRRQRRSQRRSRLSFLKMDYSFLESPFFVQDIDEFLPGIEMKKEELDETVDKFINCFNTLYFDDATVAQRMNKVVKDEIKKNCSKAA